MRATHKYNAAMLISAEISILFAVFLFQWLPAFRAIYHCDPPNEKPAYTVIDVISVLKCFENVLLHSVCFQNPLPTFMMLDECVRKNALHIVERN